MPTTTAPLRIREAPVKNHSDVELKLLEAIVGREVPQGFDSKERKNPTKSKLKEFGA